MNSIKVILLLAVLIAVRCSMPVMQPIKGGGGETTNGCVLIGALNFEDGTPAANVEVMLIPEHYNPIEDDIPTDPIIDTTDINGKYAITSPVWGNFNIQATDIKTQNCALIQKIKVNRDSMWIQNITVKKPGRLNILLSEEMNQSSGYVYIKGTTYHLPIHGIQDTMVIDFLPTGKIPEICYVKKSGESYLIMSGAYVTLSGVSTVATGVSKTLFTSIAGNKRFNYITSCQVGREGKIWIGTDSGGLYQFDEKTGWKQFDIPGTIRCHKIDHNGLHWIGTNDGLFVFDGVVAYPSIIDSGDTIYDDIVSIFVDGKNKKWIVTPDMVFSGDIGSWQYSNYLIPGITDLVVDESGIVWIATMFNGILADYGNGFEIFNVDNSLMPTNIVNFLALDSAGVVWAGTTKGIVKISGSDINTFPQSKFTDIAHGVVSPSGELWFSGNTMNLGSFQETNSYDPMFLWGKNVAIESIDIDSSGVVWAGSYGGGLVRIEHSTE